MVFRIQLKSSFVIDPVFKFKTITQLDGIDFHTLHPRMAWHNPDEYDKKRILLAQLFIENYQKYQQPGMTDYSSFGPTVNVDIH